MASMGDMLKLMQGGTDRTGFADMADQYAYEKPDRSAEERLALLKAAMEAGQGGEEGGEETNSEKSGYDFGPALDIVSKVADPTGVFSGNPINPFRSDEEIKNEDYHFGNFVPNLFNIDKELEEEKEFTDNFDLNDYLPFADGGRVEMQQGGAPGGMAMPGLLGVSSGSSGNLFSNYMPNPSAVPGPNYGTTAAPNYSTYQAPSLTSLFSPYSGNQFGNIGDSLGGPDPYAVAYNPYVDMGGSAYDQYGMGMTQEDIDKVFADTDKFSLAAQAAKKKAEEEAKKKQGRRNSGNDRQDAARQQQRLAGARLAQRNRNQGSTTGGTDMGGGVGAGGNYGGGYQGGR